MDASANHVIIVGGPEKEAELLAISLDDGEAIPLFESIEEADVFLDSTGEFGKDWVSREVAAPVLLELLEYQGEEVEHVALSPPPERLEGGMEVEIIPRYAFASLLERQLSATAEESPGKKSLWRRLFGR